MIKYTDKDIFEFEITNSFIICPVNTVGVMGKGLAKEIRDRYPGVYRYYKDKCNRGLFDIGVIDCFENVILFPTKKHWKEVSQLSYIEIGLKRFVECVRNLDILKQYTFIFPALGCGCGKLKWDEVKPLMEKYLSQLEDVSIYISTLGV